MKKYGFAALLVAIVAVMIGLFAIANNNTASKTPGAVPLGVKHPELGRQHIPVGQAHDPYNSNTPSSGPHYASPIAWGVKTSEVADETLIHNAEHGGIIISYKPDLPAAQVDNLKQIAENLPQSTQFNEVKVVMAPRAKNDAPIQLMAWTYTLSLQTVDSNTIQQFYADHLDKGPELVP